MDLVQQELEKRITDSYELPNNVLNAVPEPLVTVRTSTYQHGPYIKECIEGVLMQKTTFPFEFIIGEDFSTDGTREIVFEYAKKYPDIIRVITADYNVGVKANGRRSFRAWRGKYFATCEGDDYWTDPNKLQAQVDILEANPEYSLCFHNATVIYEGSKRPSHPFGVYDKDIYTIEDVIEKWFVSTQSALMKTSVVEHFPWRSRVFNGDYSLLLLAALKGPFYCINKEMSIYRKHATSLSATQKMNFIPFKIMECLDYFDMHSDFKYHDLILKRKQGLIDQLYRVFIYERPLWAKLLSFDYYRFKLKAVFRIAGEKYRQHGWSCVPQIWREIVSRFG